MGNPTGSRLSITRLQTSSPPKRSIAGCCARAARLQATVAPPSSAMNSRRLMGAYPKAKDRGRSIAGLGVGQRRIATKSGRLHAGHSRYDYVRWLGESLTRVMMRIMRWTPARGPHPLAIRASTSSPEHKNIQHTVRYTELSPARSACAPLKLEVLSNKTPSAVRNRNGRAELKAVAG